jgi:hypothetical protein
VVSSDAKGERDKAWESLCRAEGWVCRICGGVPERGQHFTDNLSLGLDLSRVFRQLTGRLANIEHLWGGSRFELSNGTSAIRSSVARWTTSSTSPVPQARWTRLRTESRPCGRVGWNI